MKLFIIQQRTEEQGRCVENLGIVVGKFLSQQQEISTKFWTIIKIDGK